MSQDEQLCYQFQWPVFKRPHLLDGRAADRWLPSRRRTLSTYNHSKLKRLDQYHIIAWYSNLACCGGGAGTLWSCQPVLNVSARCDGGKSVGE